MSGNDIKPRITLLLIVRNRVGGAAITLQWTRTKRSEDADTKAGG
jgi:hypothetical protein